MITLFYARYIHNIFLIYIGEEIKQILNKHEYDTQPSTF